MRTLPRIGAVATAVMLFAASLGALPAQAADAATIETLLLEDINDGRRARGLSAFVRHAGLSAQARAHAQSMAAAGGLSHTGFEARIQNAAPDPAESNGAPDDGFTGAACENVAFRNHPGESDSQLAAGLYDQWLNSPPHRDCMLSSAYNVAGIGVFVDASGGVWATLIPARDTTPPTGSGGGGGSSGGGGGFLGGGIGSLLDSLFGGSASGGSFLENILRLIGL